MAASEPSLSTLVTEDLSSLRARRCLFTHLVAELVLWIEAQGWKVALDEGRVISPRLVRNPDGSKVVLEDGQHIRKSFHYQGLAQDLLLYDDLDGDGQDDDYVQSSDDPRWKAIAAKWESMHELATSGRRWADANHVSLGEGKKDTPLP